MVLARDRFSRQNAFAAATLGGARGLTLCLENKRVWAHEKGRDNARPFEVL
jgi:hypothetical protein